MLSFALPLVAGAGLLAGIVPLVLHFLVRRPPARAELPTVRFLSRDPRTRVAFRRVPSDLRLLLLRGIFLVLLGAALAGPAWVGERSGVLTVVLVDRGSGVTGSWEEVRERAAEVVSEAPGPVRVLAFGGGEVETLAPEGGRLPAPLLPDTVESRYVLALSALRRVLAAEPGVDSVEVALVTRPRWEAWSPGFGAARELLYPGAIRILRVGGEAPGEPLQGSPPAPGGRPASPPARLVAVEGNGRYVEAALEVLGRTVERTVDASFAGGGGLVVALGRLTPDLLDRLIVGARAGDTVVVEGGGYGGDVAAAWDPARPLPDPGFPVGELQVGPHGVAGAGSLPGGPGPGARFPLVRTDGRPAAGAIVLGAGCWVATGFPIEGGDLPTDPGYPRGLDALAAGCRPPPSGIGALDDGAREILAGPGYPSRVSVAAVAGEAGLPLGRWVLLAALLVAILEGVLGYGLRRSTSAGGG